MTKAEFLLKYSLNNISHSIHEYQHKTPLRQAAVLIPLMDDGNELHVLLTKRSIHLKHHAGQISFPGGKVEKFDKDLMDTASRETFEEIGLPTEFIKIIGNLHSYEVVSGFEVTPYVGLIPYDYKFTKDCNEVSEIFKVPLKHFLDNSKHITIKIERQSHTHHIHYLPYKEYNIWGATASMLKDLVNHIN